MRGVCELLSRTPPVELRKPDHVTSSSLGYSELIGLKKTRNPNALLWQKCRQFLALGHCTVPPRLSPRFMRMQGYRLTREPTKVAMFGNRESIRSLGEYKFGPAVMIQNFGLALFLHQEGPVSYAEIYRRKKCSNMQRLS